MATSVSLSFALFLCMYDPTHIYQLAWTNMHAPMYDGCRKRMAVVHRRRDVNTKAKESCIIRPELANLHTNTNDGETTTTESNVEIHIDTDRRGK